VPRFRPIGPDALVAELATAFADAHPDSHPLRVGLDAPRCAQLADVLAGLSLRLEASGRPVALVASSDFYRDASLRFEYGRTDPESYYTGWLDRAALQREVLVPVAGEHPRYLPSLRDPDTNRSTRAAHVSLAPQGVLVVFGDLLLGLGLTFDITVHIAVSRQARHRQTPDEWQWTLPVHDRYDLDVDPSSVADIVIRYDDPGHPAISR